MARMLDQIQAMLRGDSPQPPIARHLGFALIAADSGQTTVALDVTHRHANPMGIVQGGVYCSLADAAMGWAFATLLGDGESYATLELKINYLRATRGGTLEAVANVVRAGRTVGLVTCNVRDDSGRLVAYATSTCLRLPPKAEP